jgi:hypothetical protein
MEHSVKLEALAAGLEFPESLRGRIAYDAANKRLVFRGFMSKGEFDILTSLHNDLQYRRAVDVLFRVSTDVDGRPFRWFRGVLAVLVVLCLLLAGFVWWLLLFDPHGTAVTTDWSGSASEADPLP